MGPTHIAYRKRSWNTLSTGCRHDQVMSLTLAANEAKDGANERTKLSYWRRSKGLHWNSSVWAVSNLHLHIREMFWSTRTAKLGYNPGRKQKFSQRQLPLRQWYEELWYFLLSVWSVARKGRLRYSVFKHRWHSGWTCEYRRVKVSSLDRRIPQHVRIVQ